LGGRDREMNLWDQPGIPHKGWYCNDVIDLEVPRERCQMCGREDLRYVHIMIIQMI